MISDSQEAELYSASNGGPLEGFRQENMIQLRFGKDVLSAGWRMGWKEPEQTGRPAKRKMPVEYTRDHWA